MEAGGALLILNSVTSFCVLFLVIKTTIKFGLKMSMKPLVVIVVQKDADAILTCCAQISDKK